MDGKPSLCFIYIIRMFPQSVINAMPFAKHKLYHKAGIFYEWHQPYNVYTESYVLLHIVPLAFELILVMMLQLAYSLCFCPNSDFSDHGL